MQDLKSNHSAALDSLNKERADDKSRHMQELEAHAKKLAQRDSEYNESMDKLKSDFDRELDAQKSQYQRDIKAKDE